MFYLSFLTDERGQDRFVTFPVPRLAVATALLVALGAAPALGDDGDSAGNASLPAQDRGTLADPVLPRDMHGRAAVTALGTHLNAVAAQNDLSASRLTKILTSDKTAWLAEGGQMYYREEAPAVDVSPGVVQGDTGSGTGSTTAPAYPVTQTFKLHSR